MLPDKIDYEDEGHEYLFCTCGEIASLVDEYATFDKKIYKRLCEVLQKVSEIKPRKKKGKCKKKKDRMEIL